MSTYVFADCSAFYVSCERLFNPSLEALPIVVLSPHDNCVVALSQEAKQLGIKIGDPYFIIKAFCLRMNVIIFSANYKLYGDISHRVMNLLSSVAEEIEVNSIDEAYLKFSDRQSPAAIDSICREIREKIKKWVGISLTMGIATTKTLAKVANKIALKDPSVGVCDLTSPARQKHALQTSLIQDFSEMNARLKEQLKAMEILTVWDFCQMEPSLIRRMMGAASEHMVWELRGIDKMSDTVQSPKKSISLSRTFENILTDSSVLDEALATFMRGASDQLKAQKSCAKVLFVFLEAILDENHGSHSHFSISSSFGAPTNDPTQMIMTAKQCVNKLYSPTECYTKCGVVLLDLIPEDLLTQDHVVSSQKAQRRKLKETVDEFNAFYRKNTLSYGAMGTNRSGKITISHLIQKPAQWNGLAFALAK